MFRKIYFIMIIGFLFSVPLVKAADVPAQPTTNFSPAKAAQPDQAIVTQPAQPVVQPIVQQPASNAPVVPVPAESGVPAVIPVAASANVPAAAVAPILAPVSEGYQVGVDDVLEISILQPETLVVTSTVAPDGTITFPYIGNVAVKGSTLGKIQNDIQAQLANGYMKYPVISVSLKESRSRKFYVYGEVIKPGTYYLDDNATILNAISLAGGFTRFGSSSKVKILRPNEGKPGSEVIKVNIKAIMDGDASADVLLKPGDTVVVAEGAF